MQLSTIESLLAEERRPVTRLVATSGLTFTGDDIKVQPHRGGWLGYDLIEITISPPGVSPAMTAYLEPREVCAIIFGAPAGEIPHAV